MKKRKKFLLRLFIFILILIVFSWVWVRFISTYWFSQRERASILLNDGDQVRVISLDLKNDLAYQVDIIDELVVRAPGGYGEYPFVGVVKLSKVENDPMIMVKSASWLLGAPIEGFIILQKDSKKQYFFGLSAVLDKNATVTNLRFMDKLWWWWQLYQKDEGDFLKLKTYFPKDKEDTASRKIFSPDRFSQNYEGYFFDGKIRGEDMKVVVKYKSNHRSAENLVRIWRGMGVRVVDIDHEENSSKICVITVDPSVKAQPKYTIHFLSKFGDCDVVKGEVEGADLSITLGEKLENQWK